MDVGGTPGVLIAFGLLAFRDARGAKPTFEDSDPLKPVDWSLHGCSDLNMLNVWSEFRQGSSLLPCPKDSAVSALQNGQTHYEAFLRCPTRG